MTDIKIQENPDVYEIGDIKATGSDTIPVGFLLCDGSEISRTTYSNLFAIIGETYGEGDTSTTFNLPDLRGRFPRGFDDGAGNDPDAASRVAISGGNTGDNMGSYQTDELKAHDHNLVFVYFTHFFIPRILMLLRVVREL